MADPKHKPSSPESTLVDGMEEAAPTPLSPRPAVTPVGRRPTGASLPAQSAPTLPPEAKTLPPHPAAAPPSRQRSSGKRPIPPPEVPTDPPAPPPRTPIDLSEPPTTVGPVTAPLPRVDAPTRLNPTPHRMVVGPTGTMDTDPQEGVPAPTDSNPAAPSGGVGGSTQDFAPVQPTDSFGGMDEAQFRRAVWGLAAGGVLLVVLAFVWVMVKFDDVPGDPGKAVPIAWPQGGKPKDTRAPGPAIEPPKPTMIEQTVDAGGGGTRTVLAAAGTIRIVTDPDANVWVDGRDLGMAPVLVTLPAGKNQVTLENKKQFFKRTVTVNVVPNEQTAVRFAFSKGWIELDAPKESRVTVDGRPATGTHFEVWEGPHKVECVHSDKKRSRAVQTAEVAGGMTTTVHFDAPSIADE